MLDQDDGVSAESSQSCDLPEGGVHRRGIEVRGRLVEDEQARPRREEVGDRQALLLAAG